MNDKTELDTSVEEVTHAVAEITKMDQVIAELHDKYAGVIFDVDTPKGMKAAKEARKEIRDPRYLIENMRKAGKKPILELGRQLDGKAKEMTERLLEVETPIDDAIKEEETRAERERQAKIEAEAARVEAIQERIAEIRGAVAAVNSMGAPSSEKVADFIGDVEGIAVDDSFDEFREQADDAKKATLATLRELHSAAVEREAEAARIKAEREELAKLRAAEEERQAKERAEREKAEAEARKKREAEETAERAKLEKQRKEQAAAQKKIDDENKRIADERAKLEREQAEAKRKAEAEAEAKRKADAAAKEAARKAQFPGEDAIVSVLAKHFDVPADTVRSWLTKIRKAA